MDLACRLESHLETNQNNTNKHKISRPAAPGEGGWQKPIMKVIKNSGWYGGGVEWKKEEPLLSIKIIFFKFQIVEGCGVEFKNTRHLSLLLTGHRQ